MQRDERLNTLAPARHANPQTAGASRASLSRRRALTVIGGLAGVLGVGWLADALAGLPLGGPGGTISARQAGTFDVKLSLSPTGPVAGAATSITVAVLDLAGQRVAPAQFRGVLGMPRMGMDPVDLTWEPLTLGQYRATVSFPMSGVWSLLVTLAGTDRRTALARFDIPVR
jgi:YtkA-like protein